MKKITPTVFIVDDSPRIRAALSRVLGAMDYEVRTFESAEEFLAQRTGDEAGCLILDVCMPGLSGPELQRALVDSGCELPIIFLSGRGDVQTSVHAMKVGAQDFLTKPIDSDRLFAAVDQAFRRDAEKRRERIIGDLIKQRSERLTPREHQVMGYVICGRLNKQIALSIGTGEKTVKVHRARMMAKMDARSVAELVQLAARVGVAMEPAISGSDKDLDWKRAGGA